MTTSFLTTVKEAFRLIPLGLAVLFLYLVGAWLKFNYSIPPQQLFLIEFSILFGDACLLHCISLHFLSKKLRPLSGGLSYISSLIAACSTAPKILLSYMGLMFFAQLSIEVFQPSPLPFLVLLIFFLWAPYICSYEYFAKEVSEKEIEEESAYDPFDEYGNVDIPKRFFTRKSWWNLGYLRSLEFTSNHGSLALSVVFLVWLFRIVPELISGLMGDTYSSFIAVGVQVVFTWFGTLLVHLAIVKALFYSLQPEQRDELKSEEPLTNSDLVDPFQNPLGIRLSILSIILIFVTVLWSEKRFQTGAFPDSVERKLLEARFKETELIVEFELDDAERGYRWFDSSNFRFFEKTPELDEGESVVEGGNLVIDNVENGKPSGQVSAPGEVKEKKPDPFGPLLSLLNEKLSRPNRVAVYDDTDALLEDYLISPRHGKIKVMIAFPLKRRAEGTVEPLLEVSYLSPFGFKDALFTFKKSAFPSKQLTSESNLDNDL